MRNIWKPWPQQVLPRLGQVPLYLLMLILFLVLVIPAALGNGIVWLNAKLTEFTKTVPHCMGRGDCEDCERADTYMEDTGIESCDDFFLGTEEEWLVYQADQAKGEKS